MHTIWIKLQTNSWIFHLLAHSFSPSFPLYPMSVFSKGSQDWGEAVLDPALVHVNAIKRTSCLSSKDPRGHLLKKNVGYCWYLHEKSGNICNEDLYNNKQQTSKYKKKVNLTQSICVCIFLKKDVTTWTGLSGSPVQVNRLPSWCLCLVYNILSTQAQWSNCTL